MSVRILTGDVRDMLATLPDESVHCVVTSPPYWGLRDYGVEGQIGMEPTMGEHIETMVAVFRDVRRVLRNDGTVWLNYGDCYAASPRGNRNPGGGNLTNSNIGSPVEDARWRAARNRPVPEGWSKSGLKPKDLCMVPNRLAIALQDDGWWVRSEIIWHKRNPMPESVTDRPATAHEKVWLLTRSGQTVFWTHRDGAGTRSQPAPDYRWVHKQSGEERTDNPGDPDTWKRINLWRGRDYFYDAEAVRTVSDWNPAKSKMPDGWDTGPGAHGTIHRNGREKGASTDKQRGHGRRHAGFNDRWDAMEKAEQQANGANLRNVWTIPTKGFSGAHYATFPPDLIVPCIKAGTSEKGCCAECGAPWVRETKSHFVPMGDRSPERGVRGAPGQKPMDQSSGWDGVPRGTTIRETLGWSPSCDCDVATLPCTVLDPFIGSGTTAMVADRLGRDCIGIDLNPANVDMATQRVTQDAGMFAEVS